MGPQMDSPSAHVAHVAVDWARPRKILRLPCATTTTAAYEMAAATGGGGGAKAAVAEQIGQAVQSTSNLLQLMEQSSPAQVPIPLSSSHSCFNWLRVHC
jgi:hypothetical protein